MNGLKAAAGKKECLRVHNVERGKMTAEKFEEWYKDLTTMNGDDFSAKHYGIKTYIPNGVTEPATRQEERSG